MTRTAAQIHAHTLRELAAVLEQADRSNGAAALEAAAAELERLDNLINSSERVYCDNPLTGFRSNGFGGDFGPKLDWVIAGGESGPRARPMHPDWARAIRDQCAAAGTAFFMKQMGGARDKRGKLDDLPNDLRERAWP